MSEHNRSDKEANEEKKRDAWLLEREQPTFYPVISSTLLEIVERQYTTVWFPNEIQILPQERDQYKKMSVDEQKFLSSVLAFFASSDSLVAKNLVERFQQDAKDPQAIAFYACQNMMENVHSQVYGNLINLLIENEDEREKLFHGIRDIPSVKKKGEWVEKWMRADAPFAQRLVAFSIVEGLFFQGSFAAIFWLKQKNYEMPGVFMSNEFIARDEQLHCEFAHVLYNLLSEKCSNSEIYDMVKEAVECESEFMTEALPVSLIAMNKEMMVQYIQFTADELCNALKIPRLYNQSNPFLWMENLALEGKTNFFERRVTDYQRTGMEMLSLDDKLDF
jgi:ribonucleotide reductase beta subunit family protein with ferritin-like domain